MTGGNVVALAQRNVKRMLAYSSIAHTGYLLAAVAAGLAFFAFAAWTVRGDALDDDEAAKAQKSTRSAVLAASVAFFLAELGDKTMLATITLATTQEPVGTWLGSTVGMVTADAIAIAIGALLGTRLPERTVKLFAAATFVVFGVLLVVETAGAGTLRR